MSFSQEVKNEILRHRITKPCCNAAAAYAVAYVDDARQTAYEEAYTALQERGVRSARFVTDNLRRTGKELLTSETDFYEQVDRSRYDSISMIIR